GCGKPSVASKGERMTLNGSSAPSTEKAGEDAAVTPRGPTLSKVGLRGPWSLVAALEQVAADLTKSDDALEPHLHGEIRSMITSSRQHLRARGKPELADALGRAESSLSRIVAVGAIRRAELLELDRIARELPALMLAESTRSAAKPKGASLARARLRNAGG